MTIEVCQAACKIAGYIYSGVEWGQECFCDHTLYGALAPDRNAQCNMACPGNANEICGGNLRLAITSLPAFHSVSCYTNSTSARTLTNLVLAHQASTLTVEACQAACRSAGYRLAGLEWGQKCFCDNQIQNRGDPAPDGSAGCNMACTGSSAEICAGILDLAYTLCDESEQIKGESSPNGYLTV